MFKSPPPPKKVKYLVLVFLVKYSWWSYKTQGRIGNHLPISQFTLSGKVLAYFKIASVENDWTHFWCHKFWNICNSFYHSLHSSVSCMWRFTVIKESISKLENKKLGSKQVFSAVKLGLETSQRSLLDRKSGLQILFRGNPSYCIWIFKTILLNKINHKIHLSKKTYLKLFGSFCSAPTQHEIIKFHKKLKRLPDVIKNKTNINTWKKHKMAYATSL